jgi:antitoxin ParD1/3/4
MVSRLPRIGDLRPELATIRSRRLAIMDVTLKPELEKVIEDEIKSGRSSGPNEFLNRAVYHYVLARNLGEAYTPEEIDKMIDEGLDDIERGDVVDGEEAFRQLRSHSAERRRQRQ